MSCAEPSRLPERRPAQRPAAAVRVGDAEGQVRAAAGDPVERERRLGARDVRLEPGLDRRAVDASGPRWRSPPRSLAPPWRGEAYGSAVLFDFGGVLTTPVWDSFAAFCRAEGLDPDTVKELFREDPEALARPARARDGRADRGRVRARVRSRLGLEEPRAA